MVSFSACLQGQLIGFVDGATVKRGKKNSSQDGSWIFLLSKRKDGLATFVFGYDNLEKPVQVELLTRL